MKVFCPNYPVKFPIVHPVSAGGIEPPTKFLKWGGLDMTLNVTLLQNYFLP